MACCSVDNFRLSKEDMRNIYREQAGGLRCGAKIIEIIGPIVPPLAKANANEAKIIEIIGPIIPRFFKANAKEAKIGNMCGMEGYAGADDKPFPGCLRMKCGPAEDYGNVKMY